MVEIENGFRSHILASDILEAVSYEKPQAIIEKYKEFIAKNDGLDVEASSIVGTITDTQRLDFLNVMTGSYTGNVIMRDSTNGRGWRLHETSHDQAVPDVRKAIDEYMRIFGRKVARDG